MKHAKDRVDAAPQMRIETIDFGIADIESPKQEIA